MNQAWASDPLAWYDSALERDAREGVEKEKGVCFSYPLYVLSIIK